MSICELWLFQAYHFPSGCREDVLVSIEPFLIHDFSCVRVLFLCSNVAEEAHIVMSVEVKQRTRFPPSSAAN